MSCTSCYKDHSPSNPCYEARLSLGFSPDMTMIVGKLDGTPLIPLQLPPVVRALETNTRLRYDTKNRALVYENEKSKNGKGLPDTVSVSEILAGSRLDQFGGVSGLIDGGLASVALVEGAATLVFKIPEPVQANELAQGFIAYVPSPVDGGVRYKIVRPPEGLTADTILIGHPSGDIEFDSPIESPVLVDPETLTSDGAFSGAPATSGSGNWRYQTMGTSQVIQNTSGSKVEVELFFRYYLVSAGSPTRLGMYCRLVNGGSDFQTDFVEGINEIRQDSGAPSGDGRFRCVLEPNQKCQFEFGGWENNTGNLTITIGSIDESGNLVIPPVITIRRLV